MIDCPREQDILEAVAAGHWPQGCDAELRAHVEACPACADLATVAGALHEERQHAWQEARVPSAARVWWRAELRARREAARKATQPITLIQGLAGACAAGLVLAIIELTWPRLWQSFSVLGGLKAYILVPEVQWSLALAIAACLVLAPLALYFVFSDE